MKAHKKLFQLFFQAFLNNLILKFINKFFHFLELLESSSDYAKLNDKLIAILDGTNDSTAELESPYDKKKTNVTFNELVERIEVITEPELNIPNIPRFENEENVRL